MRTILSILGVCAALVMCGVSGAMNVLFLSSLGRTPLEGQVLGGASAAADVLKALLPFFIAWSWRARRWMAVAAGSLAFAFFAGFSLLSAIGFASGSRTALVEAGDALSRDHKSVEAEKARLEAARGGLPAHRPVAVLREELNGTKQNARWSRTKGCTNATEGASREFCAGYFTLRAELAAAEEGERLGAQIAALRARAESLRGRGAGQDGDPQVSLLSRLLGHAPEGVRLALTIAVALLVEIGAALGLYLAGGHHVAARAPARPQEAETPPSQASRLAGSVEDFCLEALAPAKNGALTAGDLWAAYREWCERQAFEALAEEAFAATFASLARRIGLRCDKGRYRGIALASRQRMAA